MLLFLLSGLIYNRITSLVLEGVDQDLHQYIHRINETIARAPDDLTGLVTSIETIIASSPVAQELAIELYDGEMELILQRDILAPFPGALSGAELESLIGVLAYTEVRDAAYPYFVRVEANASGFTRAAIYGGPSLRELEAIRNVLAYVLAVGAILAGLVGWWLARQTLRSIKDVNETAKRVSLLGNESWIPTRGTEDELDDLVETLNRMLERVRHSTDQMRRFAAQAAHELLTPLGVARTRIEVTLAEGKGEVEYREALTYVLADVESLGTTVNAVLDIARSGGGLDSDQLKQIDLDELLTDIAEFYGALAEDRGVELRTPPQRNTGVFGDPIWINRLFSNLVDNAIKYSGPGDSIHFEVEVHNNWVCVSVHDTGIGIAAENRGRIFDSYYRAEQGREPGHGLGLALAMEIARAHGGTIEYESPAAGGSVFSVMLPASSGSALANA
jgi:signal transduction histidine kinase